MTQEHSPVRSRVSRRDFLSAAAAGGGAVAMIALGAAPAKAAKMSQKAMSYRQSPNGDQRCDTCANFQAPNGCKVVEGTIAPSGWCILYRGK
jgi:anaerobic selenocysteine-containing dehydrogenase